MQTIIAVVETIESQNTDLCWELSSFTVSIEISSSSLKKEKFSNKCNGWNYYCFESNKKQHLDNVYFRPNSDIQICLLIFKVLLEWIQF